MRHIQCSGEGTIEMKGISALIINTGTELLLGRTVNTNAAFIAGRLSELGINCYRITCVGDNCGRLKSEIERGLKLNRLIIITGGLGSTVDDITKETVAEAVGIPLVLNRELEKSIKIKYGKSGRARSSKEAFIIKGSILLKNKLGSAPGEIIRKGKKLIVILPGVPNEMKTMFPELEKFIRETLNLRRSIFSLTVKLIGLREIEINECIKDIFERSVNPTIALTAVPGEVKIRLTANTEKEKVRRLIRPVLNRLKREFGDFIYGYDDDTPEGLLIKALMKNGMTLSGAESCTGGLIAKRLTDIPGSSAVFAGSAVTYSNGSKSALLSVPPGIIKKYGAVSRESAARMLAGAVKLFGTDITYAVTGIAGPGGGTRDKPAGTVFTALNIEGRIIYGEYRFMGNREDIRRQTADMVIFGILKEFK